MQGSEGHSLTNTLHATLCWLLGRSVLKSKAFVKKSTIKKL
jgi:hypothetical protein